jgi:hypothetical protein
MFKASTDAGKTFGEKMNLSNSPNSKSEMHKLLLQVAMSMLVGGSEMLLITRLALKFYHFEDSSS